MTQPNQSSFFENFDQFREQFQKVGEEIQKTRVIGAAGGGAVKAKALATGQIIDIKITAQAHRQYGPEELSRLVLQAIQDATSKAGQTALRGLEEIVGDRPATRDSTAT